jgi:predicted component of type VI protein secretion system
MPRPRLQIRVTDRRTGVASDHRFTTGPVRIGREPGNELQLADPYVSAEHARLELDDAGAQLHDLGGTNGLRVAGRRLAPHTILTIPHRLRVSLGPYDLEIFHHPDRDRRTASGDIPEPGPADLERLHARIRQLHALHTPYATARQTFETALADLVHTLHAAGDAAAARRVLAEFAPRDQAHLLLLPPTDPHQSAPQTQPVSPTPTPQQDSTRPPHLSLPPAPSLTHPRTPPPSITDPRTPTITAPSHSSVTAPRIPPAIADPRIPPAIAAPRIPPPLIDPQSPAPSPHRPTPSPTSHTTAAPRPARELTLIAEAAQTLLPGQRPPASLDEARRFLTRLVLTLQTLAAGTGALQHLRLRQARDLGLVPADTHNALLGMTTADELLAHLLAWNGIEPDRNHELLDALAALLAHARAHVTATLAATRHIAAELAPPTIEQQVATSSPFRSRALWRGFLDRYTACLGDGTRTASTLREHFRSAYADELQRQGLPLTPATP